MADVYAHVARTMAHRKQVAEYLSFIVTELTNRATNHDASKLTDPTEMRVFSEFNPGEVQFGTPEYFERLNKMRPALMHHYAVNDHHPEHNLNGVDGMNLINLIEMLCDWLAVSDDIDHSITVNTKRFDMSPQLETILRNTVQYMAVTQPIDKEKTA